MSKRRKPWNWFRIGFLGLLVMAAFYVNQVIVPGVPPIGIPTPTATRDPESFISEAEQLVLQGKLNQAIDAYTQVVHARPKDSASYIAMARAQVWAGKYEDAQKSADYAILLNPTNSTAHAVRGWALDFQGKYLDSETSIKRALELDGNNALAHAYYAELLIDQHQSNAGALDNIQRAKDESKRALELAVGSTRLEAHRARGYVYSAVGDNELAIVEYLAAIAINKNIEDLQLNLGLNYQALQIYDKALAAYGVANTLNAADPLPNLYTSRIYAGIGEYALALQWAKDAEKAAPGNASLHGNLGVMYYRNFKYDEAAQELALVVNGGTLTDGTVIPSLELASAARVSEYYFTYGLALVKLDRCGEALPVFQKIINTVPLDEIAVFNAQDGINKCAAAANDALTPDAPSAADETPTPTILGQAPTPSS